MTVDYSRYYEVSIMQSTTAEKVIDQLDGVFTRHGFLVTVRSRNGPQFIFKEFDKYCKQNDLIHHRVTAKWPKANGEVEIQNRSIMK